MLYEGKWEFDRSKYSVLSQIYRLWIKNQHGLLCFEVIFLKKTARGQFGLVNGHADGTTGQFHNVVISKSLLPSRNSSSSF